MTNNVIIRNIAEGDVSCVATIDKESFSDTWGEEYFNSCLNDKFRSVMLVADASGTPIGYVTASSVAFESEILRIAVSKSHKGHGLGGALLDAFIKERRALGDEVIFLEVRESNTPAVSLYLSRGFAVYTKRSNYYKNPTEDALLMRLEL